MNKPTHFFYRYFRFLGGLIQPMLEVTGYLKLDYKMVGLRQTWYVMFTLICQLLSRVI